MERNSDAAPGYRRIHPDLHLWALPDRRGDQHKDPAGDLNNLIKDLKGMLKQYYLHNLVDTLFEYEFLK